MSKMALAPEVKRELLTILTPFIKSGCQFFLFGSRVSGHWRDNSDLDILLVAPDDKAISYLGQLHEAFENSNIPYKVDLVAKSLISKEFLATIESSLVPVTSL